MQTVQTRKLDFGPRRAVYVDITDLLHDHEFAVDEALVSQLEELDVIYRTLCGVLYNFVPQSGHPGGSISSGRIVEALLYHTMRYNMSDPDDLTADIISYAAGHKAMGLYAMWALRNEILRQYDARLLPSDVRKQMRLEDLLGFRRNPTQHTPLFKEFQAKPLDGHPSPLVPFVKLSTGASGVGVPSSFGLGFAVRDYFGNDAPFVHVIEGEGGLTPGRTHEAMAAAATAQVNNIILHLDWNQASIDSDQVCREGEIPGDYVQWDPMEYAFLHDWNVIQVPRGFDFRQILTAQKVATRKLNDQPTAIIYRTIKGWQYGIEGKGSHGAGHAFCSEAFYAFLKPFEERFGVQFPRFTGEKSDEKIEALFYDYLLIIRDTIGANAELVQTLGKCLQGAAQNLAQLHRQPRPNAPEVNRLYRFKPAEIPPELITPPGASTTLRASLGNVLNYLNKASGGAVFAGSADLFGSTSIKNANDGFPDGFWNAVTNTDSRLMTIGGICEDAMGALMSGISAFGKAIGVGSSYAAFIAALEHIAARLHGIGQQAKHDYNDAPYNPFILVCAHAGLKTGEDGPTHADPQPLQLLQENFPRGVMITLTPWDPNEMWPLLVAALNQRPAIIAPFVTRPTEKIFDREKLHLPPLEAAAQGVYAVRKADPTRSEYHGTLVIQGSGVMNTFVGEVLPQIDEHRLNMNIFYITSVELFNMLPVAEQEAIFPPQLRLEAMGITGFTMPTLHRWIWSEEGQRRTLYPFRESRYLGSGQAHKVLEEANLHGAGQWQAIRDYAHWMATR
jgi:transketolase